MIYILIIALIAGVDILIKNTMERYYWNAGDKYIFGKFIRIHKLHNKGGFLNILENHFTCLKSISGIILLLLAIVFVIVLPKQGKGLIKIGLALILGGAISNEYDRFVKGSVTDYFSIQLPYLKKIVFNLGDFAIFIGAIYLLFGISERRQ